MTRGRPFQKGHKINVGRKHTEFAKKKMRKAAKENKIGAWQKNHIPWNKGKKLGPLSKEHKRKISEANKGKKKPPRSAEHIQNMSKAHTGKKLSEEQRKKISRANKGQIPWIKGRRHTEAARKRIGEKSRNPSKERRLEMSLAQRGEKCHFWKGGITPLYTLIRTSAKYKEWRISVFQRDNYVCQECYACSGKGKAIYLESHHRKKAFATIFAGFLKEYDQFSPIEDKETLARLASKYESFWDIDNGITLCRECHDKTRGVAKLAKYAEGGEVDVLYIIKKAAGRVEEGQ